MDDIKICQNDRGMQMKKEKTGLIDLGTIIGLGLGAFCVILSIQIGASLNDFYDEMSILITVGGGISSTLISYPLPEMIKLFRVAKNAFFNKVVTLEDTIALLVTLSTKARREGLLSLESEENLLTDDFLKASLQLIVDGVEPDMIRESMDLELTNIQIRHQRAQGLFRTLGSMFPAWGMIGTLVGLIILLGQLDDPSKVGPSMAVALITTFYGSILANFFCIPIANKLAIKSKEEIHHKELIIEGILSIQAGENPRMMEHKLKSFLSNEQKLSYIKKQEQKDNPESVNEGRTVTQ